MYGVKNKMIMKRDVSQQINITIMQKLISDSNSIVHGKRESK